MIHPTRIAFAAAAIMAISGALAAQARRYPLESPGGLRLNNVSADAVAFEGKKGLRVTIADDIRGRMAKMAPEELARFEAEQLAVIDGTDFGSGTIEAEIAGAPAPDAGGGARGFVGIAFRVQPDLKTYDCFYLRPTNGRAEDQERRNHSVQYVSHPDWPWQRLRKETPERYESYVDLMPGVWTRIKIDVSGVRARLFVHDQSQPTLIVNDVKSGAQKRGAIALWVGPGTIAYFRNLSVTPTTP